MRRLVLFTITEERAKTVSFSRPYFKAGLAIAIRDNNKDITTFDDLKNKKLAVQIGTTGAKTAKEISGAQIRSLDSAPLVFQELANGNVDAVIHDAPVILYAINTANLKRIKLINQLLTEEYYGIPTPKNSPNLKLINDGLDRVLQNGTYSQIYQKWFKVQPPALPLKLPFQNETTASGSGISASFGVILRYFPILLQGALVTLQLTVFSLVLGFNWRFFNWNYPPFSYYASALAGEGVYRFFSGNAFAGADFYDLLWITCDRSRTWFPSQL
jgi:arginine/lysine/histidine/glutamine transport system substrate-binding/permease protein